MKFSEQFEAIVRLCDDNLVSLGLFEEYDDAYDAAILQASVMLPEECVKCFQVNKVYINTDCFTTAKQPL